MKARFALAGAVAAALLCTGAAYPDRGTASPDVRPTRSATPAESAFCLANYDRLGPITHNCARVSLWGTIEEDDPWGRWDCRTMGNHICGSTIFFVHADGSIHGYELNAPDRPGCFMEPSSAAGGFEIIGYSAISGRDAPEYLGSEFGFEVPCPATFPALI